MCSCAVSPMAHGTKVIAFPGSSLEATPLLQVKRFGYDEDYGACPTRDYLPVPCLIPASQQCSVLRFQANIFPSRIILVMSLSHFALDGTGAGTILEALAQCCRAKEGSTDVTIAANIAKTEVALRKDVS